MLHGLLGLFKFRSNVQLTGTYTAAGYAASQCPRVIAIAGSTEDNKDALPLPEGTSLARCMQPREWPSILWGAGFFLPKMKRKGDSEAGGTKAIRLFEKKTRFQTDDSETSCSI